jgi:hypothetical protein
MTDQYEAPTIVELGSVADFTQGNIGAGNQDHVNWFADIFLS